VVAVRCRNTATALLGNKKSFLCAGAGNAFFVPCGAWGCLLLEYIVQSPQGYAHFFERLPKKIPVKNNFWDWQSSKKIERTIKDSQKKSGKPGMNRYFWNG